MSSGQLTDKTVVCCEMKRALPRVRATIFFHLKIPVFLSEKSPSTWYFGYYTLELILIIPIVMNATEGSRQGDVSESEEVDTA